MLIKDIKKILKMNIDLKGKGIRIAALENAVTQKGVGYYTEVINTPTEFPRERDKKHGEMTGETWNLIKPESEVFSLEAIDESIPWILENNIDIVTMSLSDSHISLSNIIELSKHCFIITSGGNSGEEGETMRDRHGKYWFQVGAVDEELKLKSYSSWGRDMIDGASFTDIQLSSGSYGGTSATAQLYGALICEYFEAHIRMFGDKPSIQQTIDFIDKHSHNIQILDPDSDLKIGYGFLVLPEKYHFKKIEIRFPKGESVSYDKAVIYENDEFTKTQDILIPAEIVEGRTRMGIRDVSDLSGAFIKWNEDDRKIEIYVQQGDH